MHVDFSLSYPWDVLIASVSQQKREKLLRLKNREDRLRGLIADLLIQAVLMRQYGILRDHIRFQVDSYGKPYLPDQPLHFNVSHSGDWVVAAFDDTLVGIDIEAMEPVDYRRLSETFFSEEECRQILGEDECRQLETFYAVWTGKESYVKAIGRGLSVSLKSFVFCKRQMKVFSSCTSDDEAWFVKAYDVSQGYSLSVCSQSRDFPDTPGIIPLGKLIKLSYATKDGV